MQKTANYQLNQWESHDPIRRADFNSDNAKVDAALKAVADTAGSKASAEDVSALQQSVNSQIAALTTALGSGGSNCRIAWGTYTGTGKTYNSLNFDFCPVLILTGNPEYANSTSWPTIFMRGVTKAHSDTGAETIQVTWTDTGVSWSGGTDNPNWPGYNQNNVSGWVYNYCVIGYDAA